MVETHIHNDYVTAVRDGDELTAGRLRVLVVATPGHTDTHLSYVVDDGDWPAAVFTGGSLLYGSVGAPTSSTPTAPRSSHAPSSAPGDDSPRSAAPTTRSTPPTASAASAPRARPPAGTPARCQLVRIGIDRADASAVGLPHDLAQPDELRHYPLASFAAMARARDGVVVLDVRRDDERAHGAIPGSVHIPVHCLPERLDEIPAGQLWVHCAAGYRAAIAASLLDRAGHDVVLVDGDYAGAVTSELATG